MSQKLPSVSVVMATYNRSNIIQHAIRSVLRQTFDDLELIVVGDHCTDDTEAVVASFDDPRIRFVNLEVNVGEQSGPNNVGVAMARGSLIAFLNHDDLWFGDHLESAVRRMKESGAGVVWTLGVAILADHGPVLLGSSRTGTFDRYVSAPASTWLVQRDVIDRVGPWRSAPEIVAMPSQDWLWRAHSRAVDMQSCPEITVLVIPSGCRPNSYRDRHSAEHDALSTRVFADNDYRRELATTIALRGQASARGPFEPEDGKRLCRKTLLLASALMNRSASESIMAALYHRRGGAIDHLRKVRGLAPLAER